MPDPILQVENLTMHYQTRQGEVKAVDGVSFTLERGQSLGLVGESGCGKTSVAATLMKLLPDNARLIGGRVLLDGHDLMARQTMLNASAMACNAVQADFGAAPVHNFSHAFGAVFHIHHGEANAVFLPAVLEAMPEFYLPVSDRLRDIFGIQETDPKAVVLESAASIRALMDEMGHPQDFCRHSIPESALPDIVGTVAHDPLAAFFPLDPVLIEAVSRKVCGW